MVLPQSPRRKSPIRKKLSLSSTTSSAKPQQNQRMLPTKRESFLLLLIITAIYLPSLEQTTKLLVRNATDGVGAAQQTFGTPVKGKTDASATGAETSLDDASKLSLQPLPTSRGLFQNSNEVVHVIHTRFMQHEKDLRFLAKARLQLLETFTLPSILQQSNKEFLWILWVDPQLQQDARREFLALIENTMRDNPSLQVVVIGSRAKMPDLRQDASFYEELMGSQIHAGSYELLMDYCEAAQSRPLLDTVLDADDAIFYDFVSTLQSEASSTLRQSQLTKDFRYWCLPESLYWGYYNPWFQSSKRGFFISINHMKLTKECPTGAYTRGYAVGTLPTDLPQVPRTEIHTKAPSCEFSKHKCLSRIYAGGAEFAVLRSRSPASVNVARAMPEKSTSVLNSDWQNRQTETWKKLDRNFGIKEQAVVKMRTDMEENMLSIILDGMQGICTEGHSCKRADKDALKALKLMYKYPTRAGNEGILGQLETNEEENRSASFQTSHKTSGGAGETTGSDVAADGDSDGDGENQSPGEPAETKTQLGLWHHEDQPSNEGSDEESKFLQEVAADTQEDW